MLTCLEQKLGYLFFFIFLSSGIYGQSNGSYCADVERYNPRTGKESAYRLIVDVSDRKVVTINWPNGGHSDDFVPAPISNDRASFRNDDNVAFKVKILKKGRDCFIGFPEQKQCTALTKLKKRCKNKTVKESGKCHVHS